MTCAPVLSVQSAFASVKPNVIFVLADDLGFGDLGVYYQNARNFDSNRHLPAFQTPNLDRMAASGLRMDRHYSPSPVCAPARASLLSGMHQGHASVRDNQFDFPLEDNHTLATVLKQAGYATAAIGKWGLPGKDGLQGHPQKRGFDFYFGYLAHLDGHFHYPKENDRALYEGSTDIRSELDKCYSTDLFTARAKQWIVDQRTEDPAQPFFLYLAYTAPHAQLQVPTQAYPEGGGLAGGMQWTGTPGKRINTASGTIDSWIHPDYANATWDHDNNPATAEQPWPEHARRHATMVRRLDDAMGDLLKLLAELGIEEETLVVFTSDNGPHDESGHRGSVRQDPRFFRTYGPLDGLKRDVWEGGIRVPTLARWPGVIPSGRVSTHPSQFHDWMLTFAELAGLPAPFRSDGVSLLADLTGVGQPSEGIVYVEYSALRGATPNYPDFEPSHRGAGRHQMQAVYLDGYKGVRQNTSSHATPFRVYETHGDPKETTDLAGQSAVPSQADLQNRVLRLRRAGGGVKRPYDNEQIPPVPLAGVDQGLAYATYKGSFTVVPRFGREAPSARGSAATPSMELPLNSAAFGLTLSGFIRVPADGMYQFYLTTDTGAIVKLHDTLLIDADFGYEGGSERSSGDIPLQAGFHPVRIHSRHRAGPANLSLSWSGPGFSRQPIPASAFYHTATGRPDATVE